MNTRKHTQGNWTANLNGLARDGQNNPQWTVGPLCQCLVMLPNRNTPEETEANARLIAAAPDLLWMLKRLTAEGEYGQLPLLTLQQARAAIAKAEGGK